MSFFIQLFFSSLGLQYSFYAWGREGERDGGEQGADMSSSLKYGKILLKTRNMLQKYSNLFSFKKHQDLANINIF